jgi:putative membrane protein
MLTFPTLPRTELARFGRSRGTRIVLVGLVVIPLVYGGLFAWSNLDPTGHLDQVTAAVVNEDKPVTLTLSDGTSQVVPLGRSVAGNLTSSSDPSNFDWVLTDASHANAGLADGTYAAVITIPQDFSAEATSTSGKDPSTAHRAVIDVKTDDARSYIVGSLAKTIATATTDATSKQLTSSYLNQVLVGFSTVHTQLSTASDGARSLADGAAKLTTGAADLHTGATRAAGGAAALASGVGALSDGLAGLAPGVRKVADGATGVRDGAASLAAAAAQLATGATALTGGLDDLAAQTTGLPAQATELAQGAQSIAAAVGQLKSQTQTAANDASSATIKVDALVAGCAVTPDPLCAAIQDLRPTSSSAAADAAAAATLAAGLDATTPTLTSGTARLASSAPTLTAGIGRAASASAQLSAAAGQLGGGAATLRSGTVQLASGAASAADGAATLAAGAAQAAAGARTLADGTGQLTGGAGALADGSAQLQSGATTLASGLASGATALPTYTDAQRTTLADVVAAPVTYSAERLHAVPSWGYGLAPYFMTLALWVGGMAIYLVLRPYPRRAQSSTVPPWRVAVAGFAPAALLGVVQAGLLLAVVRYAVGMQVANPWGMVGFAMLASMSFVAINQALVAMLGAKGRFLGLVLLCLQLTSAGATYPIETSPMFFRAVHGILPMTYVVEAFRAVFAGGSADLGHAAAVTAVWGVGAMVATVLAVRSGRRWTLDRLHPELVL